MNALHGVNENIYSQIKGDIRGSFKYIVKTIIKILHKYCVISVNLLYDGDEFKIFNDEVKLQSDDDYFIVFIIHQ